jgi:palmitoyltransferase
VLEEVLLEFLEELKTAVRGSQDSVEGAERWKALVDLKIHTNQRTALHMAVGNGRRVMARQKIAVKLIEEGADARALDVYGMSFLHLSAQTDDAYFVIYCSSVLHVNLSSVDKRGRTPLHHAALNGKLGPVGPLLALTSDVNVKDNDGMTPLHYAVMSGNERIIKLLLMHGAERQSTDNRGKLPIHLAKACKNKRICHMLKAQSCWSEFNPASHPLKPVKHKFLLFGFYHFVMLAWYSLVLLFVLPKVDYRIAATSILLLSISILLFEIAAHLSPGIQEKSEHSLLDLYATYSSMHVCAFCAVKKGRHVVHCVYCNRCVKGFDHHCPWINNCVGSNNQRWFAAFLVVSEVNCLFHFVICLLDYLGLISQLTPLYADPLAAYEAIGANCGLAVGVLCAISSIAMIPCLYVQIRNLRDVSRSSAQVRSNSDSASMLMQGHLSNELLFEHSSSVWSDRLIRSSVEATQDSRCFGLYTVRKIVLKLQANQFDDTIQTGQPSDSSQDLSLVVA